MLSAIVRWILVVFLLSQAPLAQCSVWDQGFFTGGLNGQVYASTVFDDGSGPALYVAGQFSLAGGVSARNVAKWDGSSWSALGSGIPAGTVLILGVYDDGFGPALYAGGTFSLGGGADHIAKWNGATWTALGVGTSGPVQALVSFDDGSGPALFVGGQFSLAGGAFAANLAKWNGGAWSAVGGGTNGEVNALAIHDDGSGPALFVGGVFTEAGPLTTRNIAKWNGTTWTTLGSGVGTSINEFVATLGVYDDGSGPALYVGGNFATAGGTSAANIAQWKGGSWSALGAGTNNGVRALHVFDDGSGPALHAVGLFTTAGSTSASYIAKWNGASWSALGSGLGDNAFTLSVYDDGAGPALYTGGYLTTAGGHIALHVAKWKAANWSGVGNSANGLNDRVLSLRVFDDGSGPGLYAGGHFTASSNATLHSIGRWNGTSWSALGTGMSDGAFVYALEVFDDGTGPALFAGGLFSSAGGASASNIARWKASTWSALGTGLDFTVNVLHVFDDGTGAALFAGGTQGAGPTARPKIMKWNGSAWSSLAGGALGTNGSVSALEVFDDGSGPALYVGGTFATAGGTTVHNIARWNGSAWSALGSGTSDSADSVRALAVHDDGTGNALYAGGVFSDVGGTSTTYIARWNGSAWSSLRNGVSGPVDALKVFDDGSGPALYLGGYFVMAGAASTPYIAKWNGASWSTLGVGMDNGINALEVYDDGHDADADLFAGGNFGSAGGVGSSYIAQWHGCGTMAYCFGDGALANCPCGNSGAGGHGCENSGSTGGAVLTVSGSHSPDTVKLTSSGELSAVLSIFLQGNASIAPTPFGDGLRCVGGALKRLYSNNAVAGTAFAPHPGDPSITARSAALGDPITPGSTRYYQTYYRDPNLSFCPAPAGDSWNVSNAMRIQW